MKYKGIILLLLTLSTTYSTLTAQLDTVNVGTGANTGTGDPLRTAMLKINRSIVLLNDVFMYNVDTAASRTWVRSLVGTSFSYPASGIPLSTGSAWGTSITNNSANWNTAYTDRLKWDGGSTDLVAATGRTSLGATTVGSAFFTMTNPLAIRVPLINADNTVTATAVTGTGNFVLSTSPALTTPTVVTSIVGGATFAAFNTTTTNLSLGGAATTLTVGGTPTTTVTHSYSANATATGTTKTVNLGTGGATGSTSNINIGAAAGGTTTINSTTTALGTGNLTMTGSIGATGARVAKGWFTDLEVTNAIAGSITGNATTVTGYTPASGSLTLSGADAITLTTTAATSLTLPTSGTLATVTGTASVIADSIQRNALFNSDYYIYESAGTVYAIPHPKTAYTAISDTNLTSVLQHCLDQITTGGKIYIAEGTYDWMDEIVVKYDNTTIEGAGMYKTKLIAKDTIDNGQTLGLTYGFIQVRNQDYFAIRNLYIDGNGDNQTYIDDNNNAVMVGRSHGIVISPDYVTTNDTAMYPVIENCYIKSFAGAAGIVMRAKYGRISNCVIDDNFSNGITLYGRKSIVEKNYVKGSADVGITNFGLDNTIAYNIIENINGTKGTTGSFWGIGIEGQNSYTGHRNRIIGNIILGDVDWPIVNFSYSTTYSHVGNVIDGNIINVSPATNVIGIYCWQDSLTVVRNNFVRFTAAGTGAVGIKLLGAARNIVENNQIVMNAGNVGIELTYNGSNYSLYNLIRNNNIQNSGYYGVYVQANCDYNRIQNNIVSGASSDLLISATATSNTIWNNNYGVTSGSWLQETGAKNLTYTANADSTNAASKIKLGSQNITVTSASANNIITLPEASAATIGAKITGMIAANGFELRVATSQYSTVYLNNVKNTSTTGVEAAIPADTSFEVICIDATHWILKAWTNLGAVVTAIVPDAITKH